MKLSIVIPAYNEEKTILDLLQRVLEFDSLQFEKEIIVINDASKDATLERLTQFKSALQNEYVTFQVHTNPENMGKSQSVKKGILASSGDLVVIQDADLEYDPNDLTAFLHEFATDPELGFIYGNRFGKDNKVIYWQNYAGNRGLTLISNLFTIWNGMWVSDMEVCYKMVKGEVFRDIAATIISRSTFGFEPEVTAKLAKYRVAGKKLRHKQIPVSYNPRTIAEGKHMKAFRDGFKALLEIVKFNLGL